MTSGNLLRGSRCLLLLPPVATRASSPAAPCACPLLLCCDQRLLIHLLPPSSPAQSRMSSLLSLTSRPSPTVAVEAGSCEIGVRVFSGICLGILTSMWPYSHASNVARYLIHYSKYTLSVICCVRVHACSSIS